MHLEGLAEMISLRHAGKLSGPAQGTRRNQAIAGKLQTRKLGTHMLVTTRRWSHQDLMDAGERDKGARLPFSEGYAARKDNVSTEWSTQDE